MADETPEDLPWLTGSYRFPLESWTAAEDDCRALCARRLRETARAGHHEPRGAVAYRPVRVEGMEVVVDCGVQAVIGGLLPKITPLMLGGLIAEAERITGKDLRNPR